MRETETSAVIPTWMKRKTWASFILLIQFFRPSSYYISPVIAAVSEIDHFSYQDHILAKCGTKMCEAVKPWGLFEKLIIIIFETEVGVHRRWEVFHNAFLWQSATLMLSLLPFKWASFSHTFMLPFLPAWVNKDIHIPEIQPDWSVKTNFSFPAFNSVDISNSASYWQSVYLLLRNGGQHLCNGDTCGQKCTVSC